MLLIVCPKCGELAEVLDRFTLSSTDGPVEHVRTYCVRRHSFLMPLTDVESWSSEQAA